MKMIYSASQIKQSEQQAFDAGISRYQLMQNAGMALAQEITSRIDTKGQNVLIVCGSGNNGGDGFVTAKKLADAGTQVQVLLADGHPKTEIALQAFNAMPDTVQVLDDIDSPQILSKYAVVVDAIFGFGFHGRAQGSVADVLDSLKYINGYKVSADLPSGVERDTGAVNGPCFQADLTVTFTAMKPAMVLYPGAQYCGEVVVKSVDLPAQFLYDKMPFAQVMEEQDARWLLPERPENSHKGTFGNLLCTTGSTDMLGAAMMCAQAALRSGVGLVYQLTSPASYPVFATSVPEAVSVPIQNLPARVSAASAVVCGCGLGQSVDAEKVLIRSLVTDVPVILDADALNILSKNSELAHFYKGEDMVLTPHPAEAGRLMYADTRAVQADRFAAAKRLAFQYNCTVLLKGANTIVAAPKKIPVVIQNANSGMAKGGSGDCLAGIIGALAAQMHSGYAAACLGAYIHAAAGEVCRDAMGEYSMQPTDVINALPQVFKSLKDI